MEDFLAKLMPINASEHGGRLDHINALVHWLMLVLFVAWGLYFVFVLYRFRASKNPRASYEGVKTHFSSYIEAAVAVIEVVLLVGFSIPAWSRWTTPPGKADNPLEVRVVAEQFAWNIHYPGADGVFGRSDVKFVTSTNPLGIDPADANGKDDVMTLNQLHLEVNRPVLVHLSSKDVIHSFNLPVMRVKQDAIPGIEFPIHFTPVMTHTEPGWEIACAQLCGLGHYRMRGQLMVHGHQEFQSWLAANSPAALATAPAAPAAEPATTAGSTPGSTAGSTAGSLGTEGAAPAAVTDSASSGASAITPVSSTTTTTTTTTTPASTTPTALPAATSTSG